jgi:hypothetical protein
MLEIMIAFGRASPVVLEYQMVRAFRYWAVTSFHLALGFAVAALAYFGVLFVLTHVYPVSYPLGSALYGMGFLIATLAGVAAGAIASPERLLRVVIPGTCILAVMFPVGLNVYFGMVANWKPIYLLYFLGSVWGGYVVAWTFPEAKGSAISGTARVRPNLTLTGRC